MKHYDVAVVGAGPVGATFARYMADKGFNVAMLEKKKEVGVPLQCAGLLGKNIKNVNILPDEFIINKVKGAHLHSPGGMLLTVAKNEPEAYVLDRVGYDKYLAELAVNSGAELCLNHKVKEINTSNGEIYTKTSKNCEISANLIAGADGHSSIISNTFNPPGDSFQAVQYLIDVGEKRFDSNYVHLYADSRVCPGFLWAIPLSESTARVGLFADASYGDLNKFLEELLNKREELRGATILKKYYGVIPQQNLHKELAKDRALLLGDAASQVKPTTGGGLVMGFTCARIASEVASRSLEAGDLSILQDYPKKYHQKFKKEIKAQLWVHKIYKSLKDSDIDYMFSKLKEEGAEDIISHYGDIDTQSTLVKEMFKRGIIFSILPKMLTRRISSLWK